MPTPNWSFSYNMASTPEANGFTRFIHAPDPTVTLVQSGNPSNRRIEVDTQAGGDISFLTSSVPSLNSAIGMTAEALVNVAGPGDVGFEASFLDLDVQLNIWLDHANLARVGMEDVVVNTASNNADILWRLTFDGTNIRVYRAGVLIITEPKITYVSPFQQFQFYVEGGSVGIIKQMNYYVAGAVVP